MRKFIAFMCLSLMFLSGCSKKVEPQISNVQNICELASLECYYHNVAKEEDVGRWFGLGDKKYWLEYTGTVKLGVDLEQVKMEVKGNKVSITMPEIKIISSNVDEKSLTLTGDDSILSTDTYVTEMLGKAQENMKEEAMKNEKTLLQAEERIKLMLQEYIDTVSSVAGTEYSIEWRKAK